MNYFVRSEKSWVRMEFSTLLDAKKYAYHVVKLDNRFAQYIYKYTNTPIPKRVGKVVNWQVFLSKPADCETVVWTPMDKRGYSEDKASRILNANGSLGESLFTITGKPRKSILDKWHWKAR